MAKSRRHRLLAHHACAIGPAVQRPVVKNGEFAIRGRVNVDLDPAGPGRKGGFHGRQRVLDEAVLRWIDQGGGAVIRSDANRIERLVHAAMRDEIGRLTVWRRQPGRVVEIKRCPCDAEKSECDIAFSHAGSPDEEMLEMSRGGSKARIGRDRGD